MTTCRSFLTEKIRPLITPRFRAMATRGDVERFSASSCSMNPPRPWGKKPRGDKTAIELFLAGVRGWEASLRRLDDAVGPRVSCVTTGNSKGLQ